MPRRFATADGAGCGRSSGDSGRAKQASGRQSWAARGAAARRWDLGQRSPGESGLARRGTSTREHPPPPRREWRARGAAGGRRPRLGPSRNQLVARHPRGTGATQRGQSLPRGGGTRPARPAQPSGGRAARTRTGRYGRQTGRPTRTAALTPARHGAARWEPPPSCASWNRRGAHREEPTASGTGGVGGGVAAAKPRSWTAAVGGACISAGRGI